MRNPANIGTHSVPQQTFTGQLRSLMSRATCLAIAMTSVAYGTSHAKGIETTPTTSRAVVEPACLSGLDAAQLQQMLTEGKFTSVELLQTYLARINAYDDK